MTTKSRVPQIRFKGFSGEWNGKEFEQVFSNISNNNLSRAELNYEFGEAKNIHYGDVLIKFSEILDVEKTVIPYITNSEYVNKFKNSKLQNGDIIISDAAEDETVGKCTEIVNIKDEIVFSGLHTIAVRPTKKFALKYLGYYMNSSSYHNQLLPLLQGTKVLSISKSAIKNTFIDFPKDTLEQTKIGDYFQQLDKLIEQKEKKYQKLKQFKKAMLDKMFPKNVKLVSAVVLMTGHKKSNDNRKTNKLYGWVRRKLSTFMSINQRGERNSQYETICIRHELFGRKRVHGKFIEDYISQGWMVGGYKKAKQSSKKEVSNEEIEKFRKYYQIYSELGFDLFVKQTGYPYSKSNLVSRFAKLLPEFVPQNGKNVELV